MEALLRDHVRDVAGKKHDIVVLGHNVAQVAAQMEAYGLPGALRLTVGDEEANHAVVAALKDFMS